MNWRWENSLKTFCKWIKFWWHKSIDLCKIRSKNYFGYSLSYDQTFQSTIFCSMKQHWLFHVWSICILGNHNYFWTLSHQMNKLVWNICDHACIWGDILKENGTVFQIKCFLLLLLLIKANLCCCFCFVFFFLHS